MTYALGIDLGGTKILAGVINTDTGEVLGTAKKRTHVELGADEVLNRLQSVVEEVVEASGRSRQEIVAAGIGAAGQVDAERGILVRAPNLPEGLTGRALVERAERALRLPVLLFNDVAAAAAGEAGFGAGRGCQDFVVIFSGTGIGGAIYRGGQPYPGATGTAGELGHMVIDYNGRICGCGGTGHLEAYASRTAVVRTILAALRQGRKSVLGQLEPDPNPDNATHSAIRSKALGEAVRAGDAVAMEMVEAGARYMAAGLVSIINFYNPPRIILGGGIVEEVDYFFKLAAALAKQTALLVPRQDIEIVKAGLGDNSGIVGAALLATQRAPVRP
jgi:glucokinase